MEEKKNFEAIFKEDLYQYLLGIDKVDAHLPEAPDLEELWQKVGESYLPDAIREFAKYPTVSLGWIMYVGMALAKYWDEDWELYSKVENHYEYLRDRIEKSGGTMNINSYPFFELVISFPLKKEVTL